MKIGIGLYGMNGHQIQGMLQNHPGAELKATAGLNPSRLPEGLRNNPSVRHYDTLDEMLDDERVQLVSLCSPRRRDQAREAIQCMERGKHVYAEKPCAMTEEDLDAIFDAVKRTGMQFHEMAGTAFEQPYLSVKRIVEQGTLGEIVQVLAQKSYPLHDRRPQDEDIDGGLICQVGIHALRFIEHVAGQRIKNIAAVETKLGNPVADGGLHIAASYMMELENGGTAAVIANYLNPLKGFGIWGNEHLRIFGTRGFAEVVDGGTRTRLVLEEQDMGEIQKSEPMKDYFSLFIDALQGKGSMPLSLEDELHPTRMVIRAKNTQPFK
jgi:predicted dehydrogenase